MVCIFFGYGVEDSDVFIGSWGWGLLISVLCGMLSWIGEWLELRGRFVFVVDINWAWFVLRI